MASNTSRFRLHSSAFDRPEESMQIEPKRALFLSVEGDETERNYFEHLQRYFESSGYNSIIHIEVLRHKRGDGYSSPEYVIELLNEYVSLRNGELIPEQLPVNFTDIYSQQTIRRFLESPESFTRSEWTKINGELLKLGIDIEYRRYLQSYDNESDRFAIVIDRDCGNHSRELMVDCIQTCRDRGYDCYITNPCFEFWLLLHLCDVKSEFSSVLDKLLANEKISNSHTYVSNEVSSRAHHGKSINSYTFRTKYLSQIPQAISRSLDFAIDLVDILDNLGSNMSDLFAYLNYKEMQK